jgi:S1-C subfamily serine protease
MSGRRASPLDDFAQVRAKWPITRPRIRRSVPFASGVVAALVAVWLFAVLNPAPASLTRSDIKKTIDQTLASQTPGPAISELVYAAAQPSLVLIETHAKDSASSGTEGVGSGVVVSAQGDILTSLHVVADATDIQLTFADGTKSTARIVTRKPENDIAVLRAQQPSPKLVPATLGNPNAIQIGDEAYVVGNPFGLYASMSAGVISGLGRSFQLPNTQQTIHGLIQIDAAVNPGNSGGALLNRGGQLVGIVTGLVNPTPQNVFIGIGLAVPIDVAGGAAGLPPY